MGPFDFAQGKPLALYALRHNATSARLGADFVLYPPARTLPPLRHAYLSAVPSGRSSRGATLCWRVYLVSKPVAICPFSLFLDDYFVYRCVRPATHGDTMVQLWLAGSVGVRISFSFWYANGGGIFGRTTFGSAAFFIVAVF